MDHKRLRIKNKQELENEKNMKNIKRAQRIFIKGRKESQFSLQLNIY